MANGGTHIGPGTRYSNKFEDSDSGTGSSNEAHVIRHIDRNILACQICQQRYKEPKVSDINEKMMAYNFCIYKNKCIFKVFSR